MENEIIHRGIGYSVTDLGNGKWRWKLHQKTEPNVLTHPVTDDVSGTRNDAIAAARKAIDALLLPTAA